MEFTHCLIESGQIVGGGDRNGIVVMLIMLSLCFGSVKGCKKIFLEKNM